MLSGMRVPLAAPLYPGIRFSTSFDRKNHRSTASPSAEQSSSWQLVRLSIHHFRSETPEAWLPELRDFHPSLTHVFAERTRLPPVKIRPNFHFQPSASCYVNLLCTVKSRLALTVTDYDDLLTSAIKSRFRPLRQATNRTLSRPPPPLIEFDAVTRNPAPVIRLNPSPIRSQIQRNDGWSEQPAC